MKKILAVLLVSLGISPSGASQKFEASAGFDSEIIKPFLERLNKELSLELDVPRLVSFTESVHHDDEEKIDITVQFEGKAQEMEYRVFKDDPYAPDLYFFTKSEKLAISISDQFDAFFEEQGM